MSCESGVQLQGLQEQPGPDRRRGERQSAVKRALAGGVTRPWRRPEPWVTVFHVSAFTSVGSRRRGGGPGCFYPTHQQRQFESQPVSLCRKFATPASSNGRGRTVSSLKYYFPMLVMHNICKQLLKKCKITYLTAGLHQSHLSLQLFNQVSPPKKLFEFWNQFAVLLTWQEDWYIGAVQVWQERAALGKLAGLAWVGNNCCCGRYWLRLERMFRLWQGSCRTALHRADGWEMHTPFQHHGRDRRQLNENLVVTSPLGCEIEAPTSHLLSLAPSFQMISLDLTRWLIC